MPPSLVATRIMRPSLSPITNDDHESRLSVDFDSDAIDFSGVNDQRGSGGGTGIGLPGGLVVGGGGLGLVGLLVVALFNGFFGAPQPSSPPGISSSDIATRCRNLDNQNNDTDCRMIKVYNLADQVWRNELARTNPNVRYRKAKLTFFSNQVRTGCGVASASVGPFYCPADDTIYLDLVFMQKLQNQIGAQGAFAQAYIVAHEYGHHVQNLLGTSSQVQRQEQLAASQAEANKYSVALEVQADCYAGVWTTLANQLDNGLDVTTADMAQAQRAAQAVGDDALQQQAQGHVQPDSFTHGTSQQRLAWLEQGARTANPQQCTTFAQMHLPLP